MTLATTDDQTTIPSRDREDPAAVAAPRTIAARRGTGDVVFFRGAAFTGLLVLAIMGVVGLFLGIQATQALRVAKLGFLTTSEWEPDRGEFGILSLIFFTVSIGGIAVLIATPIALGTSLFITEVAPARLRTVLVAGIDLMAAVPSVVYGLFGLYFLQNQWVGVARWINAWFGWLPFLGVSGAEPDNPISNATVYSASTVLAGIIVAMMVIPIQTTVMREVFSQVPAGEREGAYALGSTRWGMIRSVALPFGKGGVIGGTMLGLGRALGETIAVLLVFSPRFDITLNFFEKGTNSVSANIARLYNEASPFGLSALMAAGLALFSITLVVNFVASAFIARSRSGSSSEA